MSEQDNLQTADGKEQKESTINTSEKKKIITEETVVEAVVEAVEETVVEAVVEAVEETVVEAVEETVVEAVEDKVQETVEEAVEDKVQETVEETVKSEGDDHGIDAIHESNAEDAEDEGNSERHTIEHKPYDKMSMDELVDELHNLVSNEKVQAIKEHVNNLRTEFMSQFHSLLEEKKEEFIHEGGKDTDFYYSNPIEKRFKDAYREYKNKLHSHYKNIENSLKENLVERLQIIEEIKGLFNVEESINTTYKHFKELQEQWKNAGPIPKDKYNNAWNSYHHHVEIFYDFLHLNRDLRDLDFKHNLEQKLKIIDRAEELAKDDDLNRAFRELQVLHKMWKEELGPVAKEHRDVIWERFKKATKTIHDKRQIYFSELDKVYEQNLEKKHEIIAKIDTIAQEKVNSHSAWQNKIKDIEALRKEFFSAGKVPIKVNEATWTKFKDSVRNFNRNKNAFYKDLKKEQYVNLQKKMDLIKTAEDNKDSEDFETTTPLMKKIQSEWKKIGHVPRKDSDKVWNEFKTACNHYFNKFHSAKDAENKEGYEIYDKKNEILGQLKNLKVSGEQQKDLSVIKDHISTWKSLGHVPPNKRYIEGKLNKTLDGLFKSLDIDKNEAEMIKFENKLENLNSATDTRFLDNERTFIRKKIDEIKGEVNQLENNLLFFKNVNDENPIVKEVHTNIKKHKDSLKLWKIKLRKIKELY